MHGTIAWLTQHRRFLFPLLAVLLVGSLAAAQFWPVYSSPKIESRAMLPSSPSGNPSSQEIFVDESGNPVASGEGLQIVLSEGAEQPQTVTLPTPAPAEPLSEADTQVVLDRLPPLTTTVTDTQEFRLPVESLPPPRTGETIEQRFPATETVAPPAEVESGPLEVLRFSPEGEIPLAPFLSVTFNQPMVPLATVEQLAAEEAPVQLTPAVPGIWRWVGTKTLTFEYSGGEGERFPMATVFTATVPAGTRSATGGELAETVSWTFSTPPPSLTYSLPGYGPQPRDPILFAGFDQEIDPAAVLETIRVTAGGRDYPLRLATPAEVEEDARVRATAERVGEGRWLAFRAEEEFPADTTVVVNIGPGTPSAEGPLTTTEVQSFSFQTYAPLRVTYHGCSWGDECPPLTPFIINFNNPLDPAAFSEELVSVEPAIPNLIVEQYGATIQLRGATQGRTTYAVTLDAELKDIFGQTLGSDQTLTFQTGSASQALYGPTDSLITLDPSAETPVFTFYTINFERLRVRAFAVTPEDWSAYQEYLNNRWNDPPPTPPGRKVMDSIFQIASEPDTVVETSIDLSSALSGQFGHLIVVVDYPRPAFMRRSDYYYQSIQTWVQVTQIGLDAFTDYEDLLAWTTALQDGRPLSGVKVSLLGTRQSATTGEDGTARLELPAAESPLLVAQLEGDTAILPRSTYSYYGGGWQRYAVQDEARWYVFDDRQMYRPGEEVHVKGWVRRIGAGKGGDISLLEGVTAVRYQVYDPQGNLLIDEMTDVNNLGGFDFSFTIPEASNLGYANIYLNAVGASGVSGADYYHSFQVQEFRRPEFSVTARNEEKGPFFVGESAVVAVNASYFAGGPLPNAETRWNVTASPGSYSPPNWPDFVFGVWTPWWWYWEPPQPALSWSYSGRTDASGAHYLRMDFSATGEPQPYSVMAEAVVMDVNRQAWASTTGLLVHPADLYVGLRSERTFVRQGEPLEIDAIVTDLDGNPVEDRLIELRAVRLEWKYSNGRWVEEETDVQECDIASAQEPVTCSFETPTGGEYRISATITDSQGRSNRTVLTRWVSGGKRPAARNVEQEEVILIPDRETYQPGDTAEILVQAPFAPAEALLTLNRSGIISATRFTMTESTYTLRVPIAEEHIPNLYVNVDLVGAVERTDDAGAPLPDLPARPAYAVGRINLPVPPVSRQLAITPTLAATELEPGAETSLEVTVVDAQGQPVENAEVAVVVVDEAILALTNYQLSDPIATFYRERSGDMSAAYTRATLVLANPQALADQMAAGMAGGAPADAA
ncbi:MAG TPA: MG2 domain-containing protein, partial [Caldilineaceae bacterium]|nr:MG2 domain-containing protein [Caldilineaceae bacterium]